MKDTFVRKHECIGCDYRWEDGQINYPNCPRCGDIVLSCDPDDAYEDE